MGFLGAADEERLVTSGIEDLLRLLLNVFSYKYIYIFALKQIQTYLEPSIALTLTPFTPPTPPALSIPPRFILSNLDRRLTELFCNETNCVIKLNVIKIT